MFDRSKFRLFDEVSLDDFYDRDAETSAIFQQLNSKTVKTTLIVGERRSGKSSTIQHIGAALSRDADRFGFVEIPWRGIQSRETLVGEILNSTRQYIDFQIGMQHVSEGVQTTTSETPQELTHAVRELIARIPDKQLVLAIDEFDSILHDAPDADNIVAFVSALVEDPSLDVHLLLTMVRIPDLLLDTPLVPPLSGIITLRPFPKADMDQMIMDIAGNKHPVSESDLQMIYKLSGGWPYYAKVLLYGMADLSPSSDQVSLALQAAVDIESVVYRIANIYDLHFGDEEKQLLLLLAERNGNLTPPEMSLIGTAAGEIARCLTERGYVQMEADGGCRFRIEFLGPWLRNWVRYDLEVHRHIGDLVSYLEGDRDQPVSETTLDLPGRA